MEIFNLLAIDPGKNKLGLAVLNQEGKVLERQIEETANLKTTLPRLFTHYHTHIIVIGNGTRAKNIQKTIMQLELNAHIISINEKNTTLEGRKLYWKINPPKGLWKLVPTTLRTPPAPYDDLAAVIIGRRFLAGSHRADKLAN